jgi:hypothetical protein
MAEGVDDSLNKISLQDKVKMIDSLKRIKEAEIKQKGEKISKEIEELEEKKKKEIKALEDELKKNSVEMDEEMFKAMDALFFGDRRKYLMNRSRLERKQEFVETSEDSKDGGPRGESLLYDISERIFAGQNPKLQEIISFESYSKRTEVENRGYMSNSSSDNSDNYKRGGEENKYESNSAGYPETNSGPNPSNYSSRSKSWLDNLEDQWGSRRDF